MKSGRGMPDAGEQKSLSTALSNMSKDPPVSQGVEEYPVS